MRITTISLINNQPVNTGGKSLSYYVNSLLAKRYSLDFYYFEKSQEPIGITGDNELFKSRYISDSYPWIIRLFPVLLQKLHLEFLFRYETIKNIKTDCILLEFPYLYHIARYISKQNNNCPIILLEHNIEWKYFRSSGSYFWIIVYMIERYVIRRLQYIITISHNDREYIESTFENKSVYSFEPGVIENIYTPIGTKHQYTGTHNLLFYGRLDAHTNNEALHYLIEQIYPNLPKDTLLNVFGSGKVDKSIFLNKNIAFHGTVPSPVPYIRGADLMIVPIKNAAGVKIRLLEGLYCEKIILCSPEAAEGLHPILRDAVIICTNTKEYLDMIHAYTKNLSLIQARKELINKNIAEYKSINANSIYTIFDSILTGKK